MKRRQEYKSLLLTGALLLCACTSKTVSDDNPKVLRVRNEAKEIVLLRLNYVETTEQKKQDVRGTNKPEGIIVSFTEKDSHPVSFVILLFRPSHKQYSEVKGWLDSGALTQKRDDLFSVEYTSELQDAIDWNEATAYMNFLYVKKRP
jgi:hypothetical protein